MSIASLGARVGREAVVGSLRSIKAVLDALDRRRLAPMALKLRAVCSTLAKLYLMIQQRRSVLRVYDRRGVLAALDGAVAQASRVAGGGSPASGFNKSGVVGRRRGGKASGTTVLERARRVLLGHVGQLPFALSVAGCRPQYGVLHLAQAPFLTRAPQEAEVVNQPGKP